MSVNIRPLPGYVVLKKHEPEQKVGILEIPDEAKERPCVGVVISFTGPSLERVKVIDLLKNQGWSDTDIAALYDDFEVGQLVVYERFGAHELKYGGEEFVLVPFEKLMGVIENV